MVVSLTTSFQLQRLSQFDVYTSTEIHVMFWVATTCSDVVGYQCFTLKMEAARSSETLVSYHITTRRQSPEDHDLRWEDDDEF